MTPGTHAHNVRRNTINIDPQPLSMTAKGGKRMDKITLINDIDEDFFTLAKIIIFSLKKCNEMLRDFMFFSKFVA